MGFLSTLPVGMGFRSYEELARDAWVFPLAGALIGAAAGAVALAALLFFPKSLAAAFAVGALMLLTGVNHFDGLLDVADALMVRGGRERRLRVMHDPGTGAAGVAAGVMVLLVSYLALYEGMGMVGMLVVAEASGKFGMLVACYASRRASHEGIGSEFVRVLGGNRGRLALGLVCYLPFLAIAWWRAPVVLVLTLVVALGMVEVGERAFGGVSGDVLGAVNELVRAGVLVVMV